MDAAGHTEVAGPLSTMVETLGEAVLASEITADWDPGMLSHDQSRLMYIEQFLTSALIQRCLTTSEKNGDLAVTSKDPKAAIVQYSTALSLNPSNTVGLLLKRSKARTMLGLWEDALKDVDEVFLGFPW